MLHSSVDDDGEKVSDVYNAELVLLDDSLAPKCTEPLGNRLYASHGWLKMAGVTRIPYSCEPAMAVSLSALMSWAGAQVKEVKPSPRRSIKGKDQPMRY